MDYQDLTSLVGVARVGVGLGFLVAVAWWVERRHNKRQGYSHKGDRGR